MSNDEHDGRSLDHPKTSLFFLYHILAFVEKVGQKMTSKEDNPEYKKFKTVVWFLCARSYSSIVPMLSDLARSSQVNLSSIYLQDSLNKRDGSKIVSYKIIS